MTLGLLLGYWPGESREPKITPTPLSRDEEIALSHSHGISTGGFGGVSEGPVLPMDGRNSLDEVFHDSLVSPVIMSREEAGVPTASDAFIFNQLLIEDDNTEDIGWQKSTPPKELFDVPDGTPPELKSLVVKSVERLEQKIAEEKHFRENVTPVVAKEDGGASQKTLLIIQNPQEPHLSRTLAPHDINTDVRRSASRTSGVSLRTASSRDSGYGSGPAVASPPKGRFGSRFSIVTALRRSRDMLDISKQTSQYAGSVLTVTTRECVSCLDNFKSKDLIPLVCHSYCKPCFQTLISTALSSETHWPPKCCLNEIPGEVLLPHLSPKNRKMYKDVLEERSVPAGERIYCSKTSCAVWIPPRNVEKSISCAACPSCREKTCTSCRGPYHATGECPQDPSLNATLQLASDEGWRRCYSCQAVVEHNQGCMHMTCNCKAQFCYICGLRWRTCACSDAQLQALLEAVSTRRREALNREEQAEAAQRAATRAAEAQAAELLEMLQEIEEYEMAEAARFAREEEERRLEAIAARQRHQDEQIIAISKKYFDLRNELEFLNSIQKVAISERYKSELQAWHKHENTRAALVQRHIKELKLTQAEAQAKISDSRVRFDREYQKRVANERQIRDDYLAELKRWGESYPGNQRIIAEKTEELRNKHIASYQKWDALERVKHQKVIEMAKEELARLRRSHEDELEKTMKDKITGPDEKDIRTREGMDSKWLKVVAGARLKMLDAMETAEMAEFAQEEDLN